MYNNILDIFYNYIIKEASVGAVNCYFRCGLKFNTKIVEENKEVRYREFSDEVLTPTLIIKNKEEFNTLMLEYVDKALAFYGDDYFPSAIVENDYRYTDKGISKEKAIMALLWSNATYEDFNDPCNFLRKRIAFFELGQFAEYKEEKIVGYSNVLGFDIGVQLMKNGLENETPYSLVINLYDPLSNEKTYEFPRIYFGICDNIAYVYAIQNSKKRFINELYQKKIDRLLYKVNEGLDINSDNYANYDIGNLLDVTPNALVSSNLLMGLFKNLGIQKVNIASILIARWNEKMLTIERDRMILFNKTIEEVNNNYDKIMHIQSNLTEKFLRVFRRIGYHHSSIMISSYPMEESSNLEIKILDTLDICNNKLLDETFNLERVPTKNISK